MGTRVIVVGAGIGGLCTTVALRRAGVDAVLVERTRAFGEVGAGIQVWVKGMRALETLGVADAVRAAGSDVRRHRFLDGSGRPLYAADLARFAEAHGAPLPVMITRAALVGALADAVGPETVAFGRRVVAVGSSSDRATVTFDDGSTSDADLVIAADGINSRTRRALFPDVGTRTASYRYVRSLAVDAGAAPEHALSMYIGRGHRAGIGDCGDGTRYWFTAVARPTLPLGADLDDVHADLLTRFRSFPERFADVLDATPAEGLIHHVVQDVRPMPEWGRGRVLLLGDAAHATTPNLGRGSGQAMLDAVVVAELLRDADLRDPRRVDELRVRYSRTRQPEAEALARTSWSIGGITSWRNPAMTAVRSALMRTVAGRRQVASLEAQFVEAAAMDVAALVAG